MAKKKITDIPKCWCHDNTLRDMSFYDTVAMIMVKHKIIDIPTYWIYKKVPEL